MNGSLNFIYKQQKELSTLGGVAALLGWDQMTYMPKNGAIERSEQNALISKLSHQRVISDEFWNHIEYLTKEETFEKLEAKDKAVVKRLKIDVEKARKVPTEFVEKMTKITTIAYQKWEEARNINDFKVFLPYFEKIVDLEKEYCSFFDIPGPLYNTLLDDYEEGMTVDKLKTDFEFLKKKLVELLGKIKSSSEYQSQSNQIITLDKEVQKRLTDIVIEKMRIPKERARVDVSTHPFTTTMGDDDVRITTNFDKESALYSFFATVHEAGHALYELNLPKNKFKDTVICDTPSLGLHESQSRFWENMIAKSKPFWKYFYPIFIKESEGKVYNLNIEDWYKLINRVKLSLIRVEADELTYCLHVILRFELEVGLMEDKISVSELPQLWNEKMDEMLGIVPTNDVEGVLQDMHWAGGSIGYFPTYAIGSIYSTQIYNELVENNPQVITQIENGNFSTIITWLDKKIHKYGRLYKADEIVKKCCGEGLNSKVFVNYLKEKYLNLYEV